MSDGSKNILVKLKAVLEGDREVSKAADQMTDKFKKVGAVIASVFAVGKVRDFFGGMIEEADQLNKMAMRVRGTTDGIQSLKFATEQLGAEWGDVFGAMENLSQKAFETTRYEGEGARKTFWRIGVSTRDASGQLKKAEDLFIDTAEALSRFSDEGRAAGFATEAFGTSGAAMLPFIRKGKEGIEELRKEFHELGGGLDAAFIEKAVKAKRELAKFNTVTDSLKSTLAAQFLPKISEALTKFGKFFISTEKLVKGIDFVNLAVTALAVVAIPKLLVAMGLMTGPIGLITAGIAAAVLVVQDLIVGINGGESAIIDFIKTQTGWDPLPMLTKVANVWHSIDEAVRNAGSTMKGFSSFFDFAMQKALSQINEFSADFKDMLGPIGQLFEKLGFDSAEEDRKQARRQSRAADRAFNQGMDVFDNAAQQGGRDTLATGAFLTSQRGMPGARGETKVNQNVNVRVDGARDPGAVAQAVKNVMDSEKRKVLSTIVGEDG